jgi:putative ABC transport system permease protein
MIRLYRVLLYLYPASFRVEYGDEMTAVFAERGVGAGTLHRVRLLLGAVAETFPNALAVHWEMLAQDLRHTARTLNHAQGFAITAVLVTALGVGANTAAFSVADFVLLRPLPYPQADRLVKLWEGSADGSGYNELSPADFHDWRGMNTTFQAMGAYTDGAMNLTGAGVPQRLQTASMTPDLLPLMGASPFLGRLFHTEDNGDADLRTVVLGYGLWQAQFDGDAGVLGRSVNLNGVPYEVIGVMPPGFLFPTRNVQAWLPLVFHEDDLVDRDNTYLKGVGRLADGVTLDQARADLTVVTARLARDYPATNAETIPFLLALHDEVPRQSRQLLLALCGASLCILLLTCANLANLLLARAGARERELAVRAALGAGRERLVRQMITESATLALIGGAAGVFVSVLAVPLLARLVPTTLPISGQPGVDLRVLSIAALFTGLTGLGFGLIPALRVGGRTGFGALREGARAGGGRKQRLRAVLVTVEVALSVVLLISSGLLIRAIWRVQATDPGFVPRNVMTLRTALPRPQYDSPVRRAEFYNRVLAEVRALPGVEGAAFITGLPMVMTGGIWGVEVPGEEARHDGGDGVSLRFVTPQFFSTLGIPILRGRDVADGDSGDRPFVALVSASFVTRHWPNEDPIGKQFQVAFHDRTVVGVVGDVKVRGLERMNEPQVYLPAPQVPAGGLINYDPKDLVIRHAGPSAALLPVLRRIIQAADPAQPISDVRPLAEVVAGETATRRAQLLVLGALAAIALLLSGVGIHGLLAYTVSQRSHEIGVRLALGAEPAAVARMVMSEGMRLALLGVVPGVLGAYAAARGMSALLFGVEPSDPATIASVVIVVLLMALAGSLLPALRAVRVNPMQVLRAE